MSEESKPKRELTGTERYALTALELARLVVSYLETREGLRQEPCKIDLVYSDLNDLERGTVIVTMRPRRLEG